jgi:hypothetical protein
MAREGPSPTDLRRPGARSARGVATVVALSLGVAAIAWLAEQFDVATGRFAPLRGSPDWIQSPNEGADRYEFTTLAPGRYRVADGSG